MADIQIMSFNAGELSELLDGRSDLEKYYSGVRIGENMIPLSYGPAERRPGTYFVAECKNSDKKATLVAFQYSTEQAYIIEYGDEYIRFFKDNGQIIEGVGTDDLSGVDALIAHWKLDETIGVIAVNADNPGTYDGTATEDASILHEEGKVGTGCFDLDGQYTVEIADAAAFSFDDSGDNPFSIICWAYVTQQTGVQVLLSKWRDVSTVSEWRFSLDDANKLQLHLADTSADLSSDVVAHWKLNDNAANTNVICSLPQYDITSFNDAIDTVMMSGPDLTDFFPDGSEFTIENSVANDGQYTVVSTNFAAGDFTITIAGASLADADATGTPTVAPHAGVSDDSNTADINDTGKIDGCLDFGGDQAIEIADADALSFDDSDSLANPFSIAAWVYVTGYVTTQMILSKYDLTTDSEAREWYFFLDAAEVLNFRIYDESANAQRYTYTNDVLAEGWHFVVATYNGVGGEDADLGMTIYVDNVAVDQTRWGSGTYAAMENLGTEVVIGAAKNNAGALAWFFRDKIDNVILFNIELTVAQISTLWNDGNGTETLSGATPTPYAVSDDAIGLGWHLFGCTYDSAGGANAALGINLYVDGVNVALNAIDDDDYTAMQAGVEAVRIGSQNSSGDTDENFWGDKIDEVSIFSDVLTPAEMASLYSTTPYEIESDYLEADLPGLQHAQSADVLFNVHGDYPQSKLIRYAHNIWELEDIVFDWPPFLDENITDTTLTCSGTTDTIDITASTPIFTADMVGSYWLIKHPRTADETTAPNKVGSAEADGFFTTAGEVTGSLKDVKGTWKFQTAGTWTGEIAIERSYDDGSTWHTLTSVTSEGDQNFNISGNEENGNAWYRARAVDPPGTLVWANDTIPTLSVERYYHYGIVKITGFTSATSVTATVIRTIGSTDATKLWSEGAWSDERGYPVATTFFEGRQFYAGTRYRPLDVWGSNIPDYENMERGTLDTDSVRFVIDSGTQNMIRWLVGQEVLLIGTSGGEWRLGSVDPADAITPTNPMRPRIQTTYGSKEIQALLLANAVLFVDRQGRRVRGAQYIFEKGEAGGYDAPDYTMLSEHITKSGIVGMAYQQNPYPILWCWRTDGKMIGMVFEPGQKVWGWFPLVIDGDVESVAVEQGTPEDTIWIIVKREIGGVDKRYIEYFKPRDWGDDQADCFFVDSGLSFDGGDAVTITGISKADPGVVTAIAHGFSDGDQVKISGVAGMTDVNNKVFTVDSPATDSFSLRDKLDTTDWDTGDYDIYVSGGTVQKVDNVFGGLGHLEGKTVSVLGDGSVHADVVVSSGIVTLTDYFNKCHIGLPYTSKLMPMKLAVPGANIKGKVKRIHQIIFSFYKTLGAKFGTTEGSEVIPFRRTTDAMGSAPPLFTDEKIQTFPGDYGYEGDIYVEQTQPLPMTIRSITAKLKIYGD